MKIRIIGAESLGVRSMCCVVELRNRRVLIDPGVALAPFRFKLSPHKVEIERAAKIREKILTEVELATDIVISHFHGDHAPMLHPDPFQLPLADFIKKLGKTTSIWVKGRTGNTRLMAERFSDTVRILGERVIEAECRKHGELTFSLPVGHGNKARGMVLMTRVSDGQSVFVHGSDIQLLDDEAVATIITWKPDVVFVAGPPLYLSSLNEWARTRALANGVRLAQSTGVFIVDHHLLRTEDGKEWLKMVRGKSKSEVVDGASFMGVKTELLEAKRKKLYQGD
ncbi:MAG: MBL fold metallo-hydrolase [bacterium]